MNIGLYVIALLSLSQASIIIKWSHENPLILGFWRLLIAATLLKSWTLFQKTPEFKEKIQKSQWVDIFLTGVFFFMHLFSYAYAAHHTSIAHLMLIYSVNPIFTAVGNLCFFKEKITKRIIMAFLLSFAGIYYLVSSNKENLQHSFYGDVTALLAALTFSIYALLSKKSRRNLPNSIFASSFYAIASGCFLMTLLSLSLNPVPSNSRSIIAIILLALFPTILGHGIFTYCMKFIDIQLLSLGKLVEPLLSAVSAWIFFSEPITKQHFISFVLISSGILLVLLKPPRT
jgi:drug/metabolite transporter (DMT)-like permease